MRGAEEPVYMAFQFEDVALVKPDAFKYAVAIQQSVVENRNASLVFVIELSVYIYLHFYSLLFL